MSGDDSLAGGDGSPGGNLALHFLLPAFLPIFNGVAATKEVTGSGIVAQPVNESL